MESLATPTAVRRIMETYGFHFRKSLGQNFLVDRNILDKIVQSANVRPQDLVIEIGPGIGTLTQVLAETGARVIAIEIDKLLIEVLGNTMAAYPNVTVIHDDALKVSFTELLAGAHTCKVVANLPYYITSPLLMKLYEEGLPLTVAVVMVQREVALRIGATPGSKDYGALTVGLAYYADAEIVASAPRSVFFPPPNVDSSVVRLTSRPFPYPAAPAAVFSQVVRAAFGQRRKTLRNALRSIVAEPDVVLAKAQIDGTRRGETLSPAEFGQLSLAVASMLTE